MPKQTTPGAIGNGWSLLPTWLRALFAWRVVRETGVWTYSENSVTGWRRVRRVAPGWQPVDADWLEVRADRLPWRAPETRRGPAMAARAREALEQAARKTGTFGR